MAILFPSTRPKKELGKSPMEILQSCCVREATFEHLSDRLMRLTFPICCQKDRASSLSRRSLTLQATLNFLPALPTTLPLQLFYDPHSSQFLMWSYFRSLITNQKDVVPWMHPGLSGSNSKATPGRVTRHTSAGLQRSLVKILHCPGEQVLH